MNVLDLFSGIGGFSLGLGRAGFTTVAFCEIDSFCRAVLARHWPAVPIHEDIRELDGTQYRGSVDLVCGGPPCQPASIAGKRLGAEDDRWLWPEALRVAFEVRPEWLLFENPDDLTTLNDGVEFEKVLSAMEGQGYEVQTFDIPACGVDAHHIRHRVWIVAHASRIQPGRQEQWPERERTRQAGESKNAANANGSGIREQSGRGSGEGGSGTAQSEQFGEDVANAQRAKPQGRAAGGRAAGGGPSGQPARRGEDVADTQCSRSPRVRNGSRSSQGPPGLRSGEGADQKQDVSDTGRRRSKGSRAELGGWQEPSRGEPEPGVGGMVDGLSRKMDGDLDGNEMGGSEASTEDGAESIRDGVRGLRGDRETAASSSRLQQAGSVSDSVSSVSHKSGSAGRAPTSETEETVQGMRDTISPETFQETQHLQSRVSVGDRQTKRDEAMVWAQEPEGVPRVATGVPDRVKRLKALGNSVLPQIPEIIGRAIMDHASDDV